MKRISSTIRQERIPKEFALASIPLMNLFVVLIPFLLQAAVFSKTAILNLYLPSSRPAQVDQSLGAQQIVPTIVIMKDGFFLQVGGKEKFTLPFKNGDYDFTGLQEKLIGIKEEYPTSQSAVIFVEPNISYGLVVTTMDSCREYSKTIENESVLEPLFPMISLGEYRGQDKIL